ncbi:MAG: efflux RND transporter periplasmic adaptor subunit [Defluviitaleaceae bacterium]|nr:efflux RND transporter periplasmic adaptor subunit [Defluviitaleaceae bacterium]
MDDDKVKEKKEEAKEEVTKTTEASEKKNGKGKIILVLALTLILISGVGAGLYFYTQSVNYLTTDNARVTTTLIPISSNTPGVLERFTLYQGRYVAENEVIGWVENGETLRSPFDGLVVQANAVAEQLVSPMDVLAVIADINGLHIQANIEETNIARVQVGQPATVTIDVFGNRQFNGYVSEIGLVTAAELTGQSMFFNTGGTFTRVTHLIPIKINIIDDIILDNVIGVNARVRIPLR